MKYQEIIATSAAKYGLDPKWLCAIIQQESQFNSCALRYEPLYKYLYQIEFFAEHPLISWDTEVVTQKTSWGLSQIMGALAREQGHAGFMAEMLEPELNIKHLCIRMKALQKISDEIRDIFAMYNGGPGARVKAINGKYHNQNYVDSVMMHLQGL